MLCQLSCRRTIGLWYDALLSAGCSLVSLYSCICWWAGRSASSFCLAHQNIRPHAKSFSYLKPPTFFPWGFLMFQVGVTKKCLWDLIICIVNATIRLPVSVCSAEPLFPLLEISRQQHSKFSSVWGAISGPEKCHSTVTEIKKECFDMKLNVNKRLAQAKLVMTTSSPRPPLHLVPSCILDRSDS